MARSSEYEVFKVRRIVAGLGASMALTVGAIAALVAQPAEPVVEMPETRKVLASCSDLGYGMMTPTIYTAHWSGNPTRAYLALASIVDAPGVKAYHAVDYLQDVGAFYGGTGANGTPISWADLLTWFNCGPAQQKALIIMAVAHGAKVTHLTGQAP